MASGLTPNLLLPYPLSTDPVNVHGDVEDLAERLENLLNLFAREDAANSFIFPNTFTVNSSQDAVRITQTGNGNVLVVEDSLSPDTTPFVIDNSGNVAIGKTTASSKLDLLGDAKITASSASTVPIQLIGAVSQSANIFEVKNSAGTTSLGIDINGNIVGGTYNQTTIPTNKTLVTTDDTQTLSNKSVSLSTNTITGTISEFNAALTDADFATLAGAETLTNKTLTSPVLDNAVFTGQASGLELGFNQSIVFEGTTADDFELTLSAGDPTADRVITLPDATDTLVGKDTADTLTSKAISLTNNTVTGTLAEFNTALTDGDFATVTGAETLTNKTIDLATNTITGTTAQFNTALSDDDFVTLTGAELLTNKTLDSPVIDNPTFTGQASGLELAVGQNLIFEGTTEDDFELTLSAGDPTADRTLTLPDSTDTLVGKNTTDTLTNKSLSLTDNTVTGTTAEFNAALTDNDFATQAGSETLTNKSIDLASNTVTGTTAEFNAALSDNDFATLDGAETLNNKTLTSPTISDPTFTGQITGVELAFGQAIVFEGETEDEFELTLSAGDPTADRTITLPDTTDTLVGKNTADTLTNKSISLTDNTISGTVAEFNTALTDGDFATLSGTETLTNKTLNSPTIDSPTFTGQASGLEIAFGENIVFEGITADDFELTLSAGDPTADRVITLPDSTDTLVGKDTTDTLTNKSISLSTNTVSGTLSEFNTALTDADFATTSGAETITNKTIDLTSNTITGTTAEFNAALSDNDFATLAGTESLTNKTIDLATNTVTGNISQFNSALSDADFATQAGTETLTNKTIDLTTNTISGTTAEFNTALSDGDFATLAGTETLTNKTVNLSGNTLSGTTAEFNTALSDDNFATINGTETLSNKTLEGPTINSPTFTGQASGLELAVAQNLVFEGATADDFELTLSAGDPTADRTITLPDASDTLVGKNTADTLTNKTIDLTTNTVSGTISEFNSALSNADFATTAGTESLTNKTVDLATNTITGTTAEFNAALSDNDFATLAGTETLTNKSVSLATNTVTGTIAEFNSALTDADFATISGTETLGNKSIDLTNNTLTGTTSEFNSALTDNDFATQAGTETLTNKTIDLASNTLTGTTSNFNAALSDDSFVTQTGTETISNKTLGSNLDAGAFLISNLATPVQANDAATKAYVDSVAEGLHIHESVVAATTVNLDLTNPTIPLVLDGVTVSEGERVLVKDQTATSQNGIYVLTSGQLLRASDYDTATEVQAGDFVFISGGTLYASTGWVQENPVNSLGTDPIVWDQFSGAGTFVAGTGLILNGNEFSISTTYAGQTSIVTLGTISTGTWTGSTIAIDHGGTGATTASGAINNLLPTQTSNSGKYLSTDGTSVAWTTVDALPDQTGNSGKFLTTDGTTATWETIVLFPDQTNNAGKFLTTDGTNVAWATVEALPDQTGNSGKYLTTDGTTASWQTVDVLPAQTGNDGYYLSTDGTTASWVELSVAESYAQDTEPLNPTEGAIWLDTNGEIPPVGVELVRWTRTATLNQTSFSGQADGGGITLLYEPGNEQVFFNGVQLVRGIDYSAIDGTSIVLTSGADNGDVMQVITLPQVAFAEIPPGTTASDTAPVNPEVGELWWNTTTGILYIYYDGFWVEAVSAAYQNELPSQTSNAGKFLTTDGTNPSWETVDAFPDQTNNSGKFLTTDGNDVSWGTVDVAAIQDNYVMTLMGAI